jgi:integrase
VVTSPLPSPPVVERHELDAVHRCDIGATLMNTGHPGLETGLLFPPRRARSRSANDQLNDVWREAQVKAEVTEPTTIHAFRHTFHDVARQQSVADAVVKAMAGRAGVAVA